MPKIHHELIGSIPAVECFRSEKSLDRLMTRYESFDRTMHPMPELGLMTESERSDYVKSLFRDPVALQRMADGVAIEFCAQHFYGLKSEDFGTINDLIDAIRGFDQQLENK